MTSFKLQRTATSSARLGESGDGGRPAVPDHPPPGPAAGTTRRDHPPGPAAGTTRPDHPPSGTMDAP
jgi:hypothetical protein